MNAQILKEYYDTVKANGNKESALGLFFQVRALLESGELRVAYKEGNDWYVNTWVKEVILLGFRYGTIVPFPGEPISFFDKDTFPPLKFNNGSGVRVVPGGSSVRSGAFVASGVVIMPPAYINTGAYIDSGTMVDSHALVGSCAQVGKGVHISAASQLGGVLEPAGALPVIVEDNVFIGGNCGIYEGTIVRERAVIGSGVILNASVPLYDNTTGKYIKPAPGRGLEVPQGAVVVAGSRPVSGGYGASSGIHIYTPVIIKYRDQKTDAATELENLLRQ